MSKVDGRTTSSRDTADEAPRLVANAEDNIPRWESWMTTCGVACAPMLSAAWMPKQIASVLVGIGLALALIGAVQFVRATRRR